MARNEVSGDKTQSAISRGEEGRLAGNSQFLEGRKATIFMPSKHAMQSASYKTRVWKIQFDSKDTWVNPLMGWTSSSDTLAQVNLEFESAESAAGFCERQGIEYEIQEPAKKKNFKGEKDYGDNFYTDAIKVGVRAKGENFFDHGENAHTSAWVNLKRTAYGGEMWSDKKWESYRSGVPKRVDCE